MGIFLWKEMISFQYIFFSCFFFLFPQHLKFCMYVVRSFLKSPLFSSFYKWPRGGLGGGGVVIYTPRKKKKIFSLKSFTVLVFIYIYPHKTTKRPERKGEKGTKKNKKISAFWRPPPLPPKMDFVFFTYIYFSRIRILAI